MSFSRQVKREISEREVCDPCCVLAACYGIACFSRYFDARGVVLHTERAFIAQWAKKTFRAAGIRGKVFVKGAERSRTYEFSVKDPFEVDKMLAMFGHTGEETALRLHSDNLECGSCFSCFLGAAFLCSGTIVSPEKRYSLEFVSNRYSLMRDFEALLQDHGFTPGRAVRKGSNVLYFKASEQIEDLLTTMGAGKSALEIMQQKVYRDIRNKANRITNCETANIDKIVAATQKTLHSVRILEKQGVLQTLPPTLQEAARLRRKNPDASLAELAKMASEPVTKSGLSHRFRKLNELAERAEFAAARKNRSDGS